MPDFIQIGGNTTVLGLVVVFAVLILLAVVTLVLNKVVAAMEKRQKQPNISSDLPVAESEPEAAVSGEVVAAITAAIVAATGLAPHRFKFTAIKRAGNAWSDLGLYEMVDMQERYTRGGH